MRQLLEIAEDARRAKYTVAKLGTNDKNRALLAIADALEARADEIIAANAVDIENGRAAGLNDGLIDRLMLGSVTDFIDLHIGDIHWPAFNIADSAIVLGVIFFILIELRKK